MKGKTGIGRGLRQGGEANILDEDKKEETLDRAQILNEVNRICFLGSGLNEARVV